MQQRCCAMIVLILCLASPCLGQSGLLPRSNFVKADLFGLAKCLTALPGPENFSLSVEYERTLLVLPPFRLSVTADIGLYSRYYRFFRVFEWPRPDPIISIPSVGYTIQKDWSILLGGRWSAQIPSRKGLALSAGIEPRIGMVYERAFLVPFNVFAPAEDLSRLEALPRLRGFISGLIKDRIGIEILGEVFRFRQLGDDRKRWLAAPELNLFVAF